jgi:hypothetical protein
MYHSRDSTIGALACVLVGIIISRVVFSKPATAPRYQDGKTNHTKEV